MKIVNAKDYDYLGTTGGAFVFKGKGSNLDIVICGEAKYVMETNSVLVMRHDAEVGSVIDWSYATMRRSYIDPTLAGQLQEILAKVVSLKLDLGLPTDLLIGW